MAISILLGQAQHWMKEWGSEGTGRRELAGDQEAEEDELIVRGTDNFLQKLPQEQKPSWWRQRGWH